MAEPFGMHGSIVVVRSLDNGTSLHEFWKLDGYNWLGGNEPEDPVLQVYVAPFMGDADRDNNGLPYKDSRAQDSASWSEAPEDIREAFRSEFENIKNAAEAMDDV